MLDVSYIARVNLPEVSFSTEILEPGRIALRFDATESFLDGGGAPAGQLTIANVMAQVSTTTQNGVSGLLSLESVVSNGTVTSVAVTLSSWSQRLGIPMGIASIPQLIRPSRRTRVQLDRGLSVIL